MSTENSKIKNPRRIPVEGNFLHYKIDDIVYGYLQASATFNPTDKVLYISEKNMTSIRRELQQILGCKSHSTVTNKINGLIEKNLFAYDEVGKRYVFPYNETEKYKIISADLLRELVVVYKPMVLKIFIYLLDKYEWKKESNSYYVFTLTELSGAMGYAASSGRQDANIRIVLEHLRRTDMIDYEEFYEKNEITGKPVPRIRLLSVTRELKKS